MYWNFLPDYVVPVRISTTTTTTAAAAAAPAAAAAAAAGTTDRNVLPPLDVTVPSVNQM